MDIEKWQLGWRQGISPELTPEELIILRDGLERDDPAIIQMVTTSPPPLMSVVDWPIEGACLIGYCAWQSSQLKTVGEVEYVFCKIRNAAVEKVGIEPVLAFTNFWDNSPRETARIAVLEEVNLTISQRIRS